MRKQTFAQKMSVLAGIGTWLAVGLPVVMESFSDGSFMQGKMMVWLSAYFVFGFSFIFENYLPFKPLQKRFPLLRPSFLTGLAVIMQLLLPDYQLIAILFIITAVEAAYVLPLRLGFAWIIGQSLVVFTAMSSSNNYDFTFALVLTFAYFGFQAFALFSTYATINEAKAKTELAQLNAELRATQTLLTESSRIAERLRIARDLHDLIGHHLTALSLNLEVASHVTSGQAKESVEQARSIAKLLLSDVRDVVSSMRETENIDLNKALKSLTEGIPKLELILNSPEGLSLDDPNKAQVLVRCVQEVITNTLKHANANQLVITLERGEGGIRVRAKDDGEGTAFVTVGNGLKGMRERLEQVGGSLDLSSVQGQGFSLTAFVPV